MHKVTPHILTITVVFVSLLLFLPVVPLAAQDPSLDPCSITHPAFGADGTDQLEDTEALQAAAAACNGRRIFVPSGTYIWDEDIPIASNTRWQGESNGTSILQFKSGMTNMTPPFPKFVRWVAAQPGFGPIHNVEFHDLGFDMNGNDWDFGGFITIESGTNLVVENCRFFDSNPTVNIETAAMGDGVQTSFTYTLATPGQSQPFSGSIVVTAGAQTATETGDGFFTGDVSSPGSVTYNRAAAITVNFAAPPAVDEPIIVTYRSSVQRQYIVFINSTRARVVRNTLTQGGRIKVGQPGLDTEIDGNYVEDANDNAITVVNTQGMTSRRLTITRNTVRNASSAGIYLGSDSELDTGVVFDGVIVANNHVVGSMDNSGILARLGGTGGGGLIIEGNAIKSLGTAQINNAISIIFAGDPGLTIGKTIVADNTIDGSYSNAGVACTRCQKTLMHGNLLNFSTTGIKAFALVESSYVTVDGNEIHNAANGVSLTPGGPTSTFADIIVSDNLMQLSPGSSTGVHLGTGINVARSRVSGNVVEGGYGVRNQSGNALDVSVVDNEFANCTLGQLVNASGSLAAAAEVQGSLQMTFATLPVVRNGSTLYCTDCTRIAPTTGGGTGAKLRREAGVWNGD